MIVHAGTVREIHAAVGASRSAAVRSGELEVRLTPGVYDRGVLDLDLTRGLPLRFTLAAADPLHPPRLSVSTRIRAHEILLHHLVFADATVSAPLVGLRATDAIRLSACTFVNNAVTGPPGGRLLELTATGPTEALLEDCELRGNHASDPGNALLGFEALPPAHFESVTFRRVALLDNHAPRLFAGAEPSLMADCQIEPDVAR